MKVPYVFEGEDGIALHAMQGNQASSRGEVGVSRIFSSCCGNLWYILELRRGWLFKTRVCSVTSGLLSTYEGNLRNHHESWQGNTDVSRVDLGDQGPLSHCHSDIGIPINFQKRKAPSPFETLNSMCLTSCQTDVRPPVQMRRGSWAFSWVPTGDSNIPTPGEMKNKLAFKPLQGNLAFF